MFNAAMNAMGKTVLQKRMLRLATELLEESLDQKTIEMMQEECSSLITKYDFKTAMSITFFTAHMLLMKEVPSQIMKALHVIKYEDLLANPEKVTADFVTYIMEQYPEDDLLDKCLKSMENDSQANSAISRKKLAAANKNDKVMENLSQLVEEVFLKFDLPPIDKFDSVFTGQIWNLGCY